MFIWNDVNWYLAIASRIIDCGIILAEASYPLSGPTRPILIATLHNAHRSGIATWQRDHFWSAYACAMFAACVLFCHPGKSCLPYEATLLLRRIAWFLIHNQLPCPHIWCNLCHTRWKPSFVPCVIFDPILPCSRIWLHARQIAVLFKRLCSAACALCNTHKES